jgi:hypothetical protein
MFNRDFFLYVQDSMIVEQFEHLFLDDYAGIFSGVNHNSLIISPESTRKKLEVLFEGAEKSIYMYQQYLQDDALLELLEKQAGKGIEVNIILSKK